MTHASQALPSSALELLLGPVDGATGLMALLSADSGGDLGRSLENLPAEIRETAASEVSRAAAGLLQDIDPIALLVEGWREYTDLTSAARRTLSAPGSSELVSLATHRVTAQRQPYVDLLVDGRRVATVRFGVSVDFEVSALVAKVSAGLLAAIHAGRGDITVTLAVNGVDVVTRQARVELPGAIPLTPGIRLLPAKDYTAAKAAAQRQAQTQTTKPAGTAREAVPSKPTGESSRTEADAASAHRPGPAKGTGGHAVLSSATPDITNEETN